MSVSLSGLQFIDVGRADLNERKPDFFYSSISRSVLKQGRVGLSSGNTNVGVGPMRRADVCYAGFYLGFFVWGGVDPKKIFGATQRREKILGGSGDMLPGKF